MSEKEQTMSGNIFTPEELAELAAFDAEIEAEPLTMEEIRQSRELDRAAVKARERSGKSSGTYRRKPYGDVSPAEYKRRWYEENRERLLAYQKEYYREHKAAVDARNRMYYQENREKRCRQNKEYREANAERIKAYQAEYRARKRAEKNGSNTRPARPLADV